MFGSLFFYLTIFKLQKFLGKQILRSNLGMLNL